MIKKLLSITLTAISVSLAMANSPPLAKGQWEVVTRPDFKGIPANPLPRTDRFCLDEAMIREGRIPVFIAPACKITGGSWDGIRLQMTVTCPDAPPDARIPAELTAEGKAFTSFVELNPSVRYNHSGRWISEQCQHTTLP